MFLRLVNRIIETYGKEGVIDIVGNPQETILYLKDKPIQYSWLAEIGSTWRYHIAKRMESQIIKIHDGIVDQLKRGIKNQGDFLGVSEYFSEFLKHGKYEFGYYKLFHDIYCVDVPEGDGYRSFDYYGGGFSITATQSHIDDYVLLKYKDSILTGSRPAIVIIHVENSPKFFLLDGHHKFYAYQNAKKEPHAIIITKLGNRNLPVEDTINLATSMGCEHPEYFKWMKKEKKNLNYYKKRKLKLSEVFEQIKFI